MGEEWDFNFQQTTGGNIGNIYQFADSLSIELGVVPEEYIRPISTYISTSEMLGSTINNYGQGAVNCIHQLPTAAKGLKTTFVAGTTQAAALFGFRAGANDKIYLNGVAGTDGDAVTINPTIGDKIVVEAIQTGASAWDWIAITHRGTWVATIISSITRITFDGNRRVTTGADIRVIA